MDRLTSMEVFVRTVELGSLAKAADASGLSAGMVGKHLRALESRLGTRLLHRTTRKIALTGVGRTYYERCRRIMADVDEAERDAIDENALPKGVLRINAPVVFGGLHLAPAIAAFRALHPQVEFEVTLNSLYVDLTDGEFDFAIRVGHIGEVDLVVRQLTVCSQVTCASPAYLEARGEPRIPEDLQRHDCLINLHERQPNEWRFATAPGQPAVRVAGPIRSNNVALLCGAAVAGAGILRMPSFVVGEELRTGKLVPILNTCTERGIGIQSVALPSRALSVKVRLFIDFLARHFGPSPPWERWDAQGQRKPGTSGRRTRTAPRPRA
jgi:DNA-binding transcriptional LysR family regulator